MSHFTRALEKVSSAAAWVGGGLLVLAAVLVCIEVLVRKVFLMSLGGADELSGYAFAIATSWGCGYALLQRAHIRIDVLYIRLPEVVRAWLDLVALLSLGLFLAVMTWHAAGVFVFAATENTHSNTPLKTPMWIPQGLWVAGFIFFGLVIAEQVGRCLSALLRQDWIEVRRTAGTRSIKDDIDDEIDPALAGPRH